MIKCVKKKTILLTKCSIEIDHIYIWTESSDEIFQTETRTVTQDDDDSRCAFVFLESYTYSTTTIKGKMRSYAMENFKQTFG